MHSVYLSAQGKTALPIALVLLGWVGSADAQPISLVPNTVNMFRDTRGANDVGLTIDQWPVLVEHSDTERIGRERTWNDP